MKDPMNNRISRRNLLRGVGAGVFATGIGGLLSACAAPAVSPAAPAATAAKAGAAPAAGGKAKLEYWTGWGGYEFDALNKLVKEFNGQSKLGEVNMTTVFGQYEKVLTAIGAGNPPDIVSAVWMSQLAAMASKGALIPLDNYIAKDGIQNYVY